MYEFQIVATGQSGWRCEAVISSSSAALAVKEFRAILKELTTDTVFTLSIKNLTTRRQNEPHG